LTYLAFVRAHPRLLAFGFLLPFASAFGQTFFIGVFGGEFRAAFELGNGEFGLVYSLATLVSAACFVGVGRLIDRVDLARYTAGAGLGYAGACLALALMPAEPMLLFVGFLALRLTGQGLMSHIGVTTMGRYFEAGRGRAVGIASLGFPVAEAVFPPLGALSMAWIGWRTTWAVIGIVLALGLVPGSVWLLRGHAARERRRSAAAGEGGDANGDASGAWRMARVARDASFYTALPAVLFTPFTVTGLFFHQAQLAAGKGWHIEWFATAFVVFALASVIATLAVGPFVDRIGARRVLAWIPLPLAVGLTVLAASDAHWSALGFMLGAGLTAGANMTLLGALWAELYGSAHLGSIRSVVWGLVVLTTAASPVLFGYLLDAGVTTEAIAAACAVAALGAAAIALPLRAAVPAGDG